MSGELAEWRDMVLREIGRQNSCLERLQESNTEVLVELGRLRLIAALCGAGAATGVSIAVHMMM